MRRGDQVRLRVGTHALPRHTGGFVITVGHDLVTVSHGDGAFFARPDELELVRAVDDPRESHARAA
jgi:hypothetical protein